MVIISDVPIFRIFTVDPILERLCHPGKQAGSHTSYLSLKKMVEKTWRTSHIPCTLKCLSIGTPKAINFPFVSNEKLMFFRCPSIQAHYNEAVIYLNFGTPKNNEFSIWNKWKIYYF